MSKFNYRITCDKPVDMVRSKGIRVYDPDGKELTHILSIDISKIRPDRQITARIEVPVELGQERKK